MRRTIKKWKRTGLAAALAFTMSFGGQTGWAANMTAETLGQEFGLTLRETAVWTDPAAYKGEILLEVSGLEKAREKLLHRNGKKEVPDLDSDEKIPEQNISEASTTEQSFPEENKSEQGNHGESTTEPDIPGNSLSEENLSEEPILDNTSSADPEEMNGADPADSAEKDTGLPEELSDTIPIEASLNKEPMDGESTENSRAGENAVFAFWNALIPFTKTVRAQSAETEPEDRMKAENLPEKSMVEETVEEVSEETVEEPKNLRLVLELSEYFELDDEKLPEDVMTEKVKVLDHTGKEGMTTRVLADLPQEDGQDIWQLRVPICLKEEYRSLKANPSFPVSEVYASGEMKEPIIWNARIMLGNTQAVPETGPDKTPTQDIDWDKDAMILAIAESAVLFLPEQSEQLKLLVSPDRTEVKAGGSVSFDVQLQNIGAAELTKLRLQSTLSREGFYAVWQPAEGLSVSSEYGIARLESLNPGEIRHLTLTMEVPEDQADPIEHTIQVSVQDPYSESAVLTCTQTLCTTILPLKLDFQVEKTADRRAAAAGDTITYHISIANTGERTLHSVLSTERFQLADVSAKFVKKEGVLINKDCTQAYISQIDPGQTVQLEAVVEIPKAISAQKLVNQVIVTTRETGTSETLSEAVVQIAEDVNEMEEGKGIDGGAQSVSDSPQTGDTSNAERFLGLTAASVILIFCLLIYLRKIRKSEKK